MFVFCYTAKTDPISYYYVGGVGRWLSGEVVQMENLLYRFAYSSTPSQTKWHIATLQFLPLTLLLFPSGFLVTVAPNTSITTSRFLGASSLPASPIYWLLPGPLGNIWTQGRNRRKRQWKRVRLRFKASAKDFNKTENEKLLQRSSILDARTGKLCRFSWAWQTKHWIYIGNSLIFWIFKVSLSSVLEITDKMERKWAWAFKFQLHYLLGPSVPFSLSDQFPNLQNSDPITLKCEW